MNRRLVLAVAVLLPSVALAAPQFEAQAGAAIAAQARAAHNPCELNKELESRTLRMTVAGNPGFDDTFVFDADRGCIVSERGVDGDPITPIAVRYYASAKSSYKLILNTELGSPKTYVVLIQYLDQSGFLIAGGLDEVFTDQIFAGEVRVASTGVRNWLTRPYRDVSGLTILTAR